MNASKQEKPNANFLREEATLRYLDQKYHNAHEWLPLLAIEAPDLRPADVLKKLRTRISELRVQQTERRAQRIKDRASQMASSSYARESVPVQASVSKRRYLWPHLPYGERMVLERVGPLSIEEYIGRQVSSSIGHRIQDLIDSAPQNRRIQGVVNASGFKEYIWAAPDKGDTQAHHLFLPYGEGCSNPSNFTGATGLQFLGDMEVKPNWFIDEGDSFGFGGILQYVLPPAPWDGGVEWFLNQSFVVPEIAGEGDFYYATLASCARQSPSGEGFPSDFVRGFSLDTLLPIVGVSGEGGDFGGGPYAVTDSFYSGFPVLRGQSASIYVGLSVLLMARDGSISLGDPNMAYHFSPSEPGLGYAFYRVD